jgi:RNA 3'-terminal phosphate cyclase (ATP)
LPKQITISNAGAARNQALRTALALGAACGTPLTLRGALDDNPRGEPGLGPGHLTALVAAARVSGGSFHGLMGQDEAELQPGRPQAGEYAFDVAMRDRSAAPLSWVLEAVLPALARAGGESQVLLRGGTHVLGGLTSQMVARVLAPAWRRMGIELDYAEIAPGFHPQGGGEAEVRIKGPGYLEALSAEWAFKPAEVGVEAVICGLPVHLAEQALEGAVGRLELRGFKPQAELRRPRGAGRGLALLVWAREAAGLSVGFASLGRRGGQPAALGLEAAETLASFLDSGAGMPADLATVLVAPLACARGVSRITVDRSTPGLRAALKVVEAFFPGSVRLVERPGGGLVEMTLRGAEWGLLSA